MQATAQAARQIGVCKNTLLRWIAEGLIPDVQRDWRGWRVWSQEDVERARRFRESYHDRPIPRIRRRPVPKSAYLEQAAKTMARYGEVVRKNRRASSRR